MPGDLKLRAILSSPASEIELFYWPTPNGFKITIMLEELAVPYRITPIDITTGEQYSDEFTSVSPNNKIPAIKDLSPRHGNDEVTLFESGAILLYLAEKYGKLLPEDATSRSQCLQWLFWQVGGLGPMGGQAHHFRLYAEEEIDYAIDRYTLECHRLYGVMDRQLQGQEFLVGEYSIADIACLPWIYRHERQGQKPEDFPHLQGWYQNLMSRKAVAAGLAVAAELRNDAAFTSEKGRSVLFGKE
ncbi:MAG: glutathione S-transferase [Gammaproteobacteria bacterium]|jgi:GST-like protein|nr:glutathione S-transferase [Gammaproteobacteria bacterium]|tara:strand:- start:228 stop:959 length:732 start_codon:yes stop_codon:yes gene_type:complete